MNSRKIKAFTLVELLAIIVIIGILAALIIISLKSARTKARDARRKSDMEAIHSALELYYDKNGSYPGSSTCVGWQPWCSSATGINWIPGLAPTYIGVVPIDPSPGTGNNWPRNYWYMTCNNNQDYKLASGGLESSEGQTWAKNDGGSRNDYFELFTPFMQNKFSSCT